MYDENNVKFVGVCVVCVCSFAGKFMAEADDNPNHNKISYFSYAERSTRTILSGLISFALHKKIQLKVIQRLTVMKTSWDCAHGSLHHYISAQNDSFAINLLHFDDLA